MGPALISLAIIFVWLLASAGVTGWLLLMRRDSRVRNYRRPRRAGARRSYAGRAGPPALESGLA